MLILEGVDRCGKTTVCRTILKHLPGWAYKHHTRPPVKAYNYFAWFMASARNRHIVDRFHWSEVAYGNTYRGISALNAHEWRLLELCAMAQGTRILLLSDSIKAIESRWTDKEMFSKKGIPNLFKSYTDLLFHSSEPKSYLPILGPYMLPDLVKEPFDKLEPTETLAAIMLEERVKSTLYENWLTPSLGIGTADGFMVIGEAPGNDLTGMGPGMPFDCGPSSEWFWRAMDECQIKWWHGYYCNASAFEDPSRFYRYTADQIKPKKILAMGTDAMKLVMQSKISQAGIDVHAVYHPMYSRRFHYHSFDKWRDEIGDYLQEWRDGQDRTR